MMPMMLSAAVLHSWVVIASNDEGTQAFPRRKTWVVPTLVLYSV